MTETLASSNERKKEIERAIERANIAQARIEWTLQENRRRMKRIRADLRRAGLLRD